MAEISLTYQYDENGNRSSLVYNSGVKEEYEYEYNKNNEVISLVNKKPGGGEISRYSYTYDKAGRIQKVDGPGKIDIYAYDGAGNCFAVNETYKSLQPFGFIDDTTGNDVQYILKKTDSYRGEDANPLSLNRYTTHNNLIQYLDPTGHRIAEYEYGYGSGSNKKEKTTKKN